MKATVVDLRYKMNSVLQALERNEPVTILYHGKPKGVITPVSVSTKMAVKEHPFFGMKAAEGESVAAVMERVRGGRH